MIRQSDFYPKGPADGCRVSGNRLLVIRCRESCPRCLLTSTTFFFHFCRLSPHIFLSISCSQMFLRTPVSMVPAPSSKLTPFALIDPRPLQIPLPVSDTTSSPRTSGVPLSATLPCSVLPYSIPFQSDDNLNIDFVHVKTCPWKESRHFLSHPGWEYPDDYRGSSPPTHVIDQRLRYPLFPVL